MPLYRYKAVSQSGEVVEGEFAGANKDAVVERLHQLGHTPIRAEEVGRAGVAPLLQRRALGERLGRREITMFTREMAILLGAGLTLERSLEVLAGIADSPAMRRLVNRLLETIRGGTSFADALAGRGDAFPSYYVSMVRAGEAGGALEVVLARLGDYMERAQALRESVRSALIYPAIVVVMAGAAVAVLLTVVLPQFTPMFEDAGRALPLSTRVVVAVGDAVEAWWWLGIAVALLLVLLLRQQLARPASRARWHALMLRLPLLGDLVAKAEAARFGRTLGTLLSNGVPMLNALAIVKDTLANAVMARAIEDIGARLKEGEGLAGPLAEVRLFPPLAAQLVRVGEETGQLEAMLHKVADIFDQEVRRAVDRMLALLVPALTLALGGLIAFIIVSILSALFSVYDLPI